MKLEHIKAVPFPGGNGIDLQWFNPAPEEYTGVRVVRRESTHPLSPADGRRVGDISNPLLFSLDSSFAYHLDNAIISPELAAKFSTSRIVISLGAYVTVTEPGVKWEITDGSAVYLIVSNGGALETYGLSQLEDKGLQAEHVYYYTLFPYKADPADYIFDRGNRTAGMAAGKNDMAGLMYDLLPIIYHRYDNRLPAGDAPGMAEEDKEKGQLRRFLDLPGQQLDQLYSFARAAGNLREIDRVDGRLLPLLAQWIGWETDYHKEIEKQRMELRNAPALYKAIGSIPTLETMIKQITGWENRVKKFLYSIFIANQPETLYPRICYRSEPGSPWLEEEDILSVDFAYDGRPTAVRDENDDLQIFYHTYSKGSWNIRFKTYTAELGWKPSSPFTGPPSLTIDKYPSAAFRKRQAGKKKRAELWVFWTIYNPVTYSPRVRFRMKNFLGQWAESRTFNLGGRGVPRKSPFAAADHLQRLWLFWLEAPSAPQGSWQLKYNRRTGTNWETTRPFDFPPDNGQNPRVGDDLFVLVHPPGADDADNGLTVFWTRKKPLQGAGAGLMSHLSCLEIAYCQKTGLDSTEGGWGPVQVLPKETNGSIYDDREPAAIIDENGAIHLCWSSNRGGNWSIRHIAGAELSGSGGVHQPGIIERDALTVIDNLYSQRTPLPIPGKTGERVSLLYRSSRGPTGRTAARSAVETLDFRSAGSTVVNDRIPHRLGQQDTYTDFLHYSYDTGQPGEPLDSGTRSSYDTVGLFLTPTADDLHMINRNQELIKGMLERFIPILSRVVFIIEPPLYVDKYQYRTREGEERIIHRFTDDFSGPYPVQTYPAQITDTAAVPVIDWQWLKSWDGQHPLHLTVDTRVSPVETCYRSLQTGLNEQAGA